LGEKFSSPTPESSTIMHNSTLKRAYIRSE
jgi:hypothetical protein